MRLDPQKRLNICLLIEKRSFLWELTKRKNCLSLSSWFTGLIRNANTFPFADYMQRGKNFSLNSCLWEEQCEPKCTGAAPQSASCAADTDWRLGFAGTQCICESLVVTEEDIWQQSRPRIHLFPDQNIGHLQPILSGYVAAHTKTGGLN